MRETPTSPTSRAAALAPALPLAVGAALLVLLAFALHEPVHIAGDGALKQYLLRQWEESGRITNRIEWKTPQPWARGLWDEFHEPFEAPFVHEGQVVFPPFFLVLSLPLFMAFGYAGLFILPAVSLAGLWLVTLALLRRTGARGPAAALALAVLVISPLSFFGMMFWEHTPGLFCLFAAAAMIFREGEGRAADAGAGFLLALAVMLRPELAIAAAILLAFALGNRPRRYAAPTGVVLGILIWAAGNQWVTGTPLGIHARQPLYLSGGGWGSKLIGYYAGVGVGYATGAAAVLAALALTAVLLPREERGQRAVPFALLAASGLTVALLPLMIPYDGEYLGFRRFELLLIPAGAVLAGRLVSRYRWAAPLLVALILLQSLAAYRQYETFRWAHGPRILPAIEALQAERPAAVVADSQFSVIELSWLMPETAMLWAPPPAEFQQLLAGVASHTDLSAVALVFLKPGPTPDLTLPVHGRGPVRWMRRAGDDEGFGVFTYDGETPAAN